jgi:hypothetical protein
MSIDLTIAALEDDVGVLGVVVDGGIASTCQSGS